MRLGAVRVVGGQLSLGDEVKPKGRRIGEGNPSKGSGLAGLRPFQNCVSHLVND